MTFALGSILWYPFCVRGFIVQVFHITIFLNNYRMDSFLLNLIFLFISVLNSLDAAHLLNKLSSEWDRGPSAR